VPPGTRLDSARSGDRPGRWPAHRAVQSSGCFSLRAVQVLSGITITKLSRRIFITYPRGTRPLARNLGWPGTPYPDAHAPHPVHVMARRSYGMRRISARFSPSNRAAGLNSLCGLDPTGGLAEYRPLSRSRNSMRPAVTEFGLRGMLTGGRVARECRPPSSTGGAAAISPSTPAPAAG
jgi:hypothetical protein